MNCRRCEEKNEEEEEEEEDPVLTDDLRHCRGPSFPSSSLNFRSSGTRVFGKHARLICDSSSHIFLFPLDYFFLLSRRLRCDFLWR